MTQLCLLFQVHMFITIQLKTSQQLEIKLVLILAHIISRTVCAKKIDAIFYHENMCAMLLARAR